MDVEEEEEDDVEEDRSQDREADFVREPAQSKRTWTFHKSHFVSKFTGIWPDTDGTTSIKHRALITVTCYRKNPSVQDGAPSR